jgi:hypothetical protein
VSALLIFRTCAGGRRTSFNTLLSTGKHKGEGQPCATMAAQQEGLLDPLCMHVGAGGEWLPHAERVQLQERPGRKFEDITAGGLPP